MIRPLAIASLLASVAAPGLAQVPAGNTAPQPVPFVDTIAPPQDIPYAGTIQLDVEDVPDIDVTQSWHRKPRVFRPDHVTIVFSNGQISSVNVSGGLVLKSGRPSTEVRDNVRWYSPAELTRMPEWVKRLVDEAPSGVTTWRDLDTTNPDEVTAL